MRLEQHLTCEQQDACNLLYRSRPYLTEWCNHTARHIYRTFKTRNHLLICGNGGSAAQAQHLAAELTGRFRTHSPSWPAIALTTDTSALTALANDFGYETVFARQINALARPGDALLCISTSGRSPNILKAMESARVLGIRSFLMRGDWQYDESGMVPDRSVLVVPSRDTARIQEVHAVTIHLLAEAVEWLYWEERQVIKKAFRQDPPIRKLTTRDIIILKTIRDHPGQTWSWIFSFIMKDQDFSFTELGSMSSALWYLSDSQLIGPISDRHGDLPITMTPKGIDILEVSNE